MAKFDLIHGKYIIGSKSSFGNQTRKWEDRAFVGVILTKSNMHLIVGVVADGVGSADFGSYAAQKAIDSIIESIKQDEETNVVKIIEKAINFANHEVISDMNLNNGDGLTTVVLGIIYNNRFFVGNVGDSCAYWIQTENRKVLKLTRDHTYYNYYGGDLKSPNADVVVNILGRANSISVDSGLYLKENDLELSKQLGLVGLPLKEDDSILLCTDGFIRNYSSKKRLITDTEIIEVLSKRHTPGYAADELVSKVLKRDPDDNLSVVTIQYLSSNQIEEEQKSSTWFQEKFHLVLKEFSNLRPSKKNYKPIKRKNSYMSVQ